MKKPAVGCDYESPRVGAKVHVRHEKEAVPLIQEVARRYGPRQIVELGTHSGGLTFALHDACPEVEIHSFDNRNLLDDVRVSDYPTAGKREWFGPNVHFYNEDLISGVNATVRRLLAKETRTLLYCDNGQKIIEINTYGPLLQPGGLLGVHDWGSAGIGMERVAETLKSFEPYLHGWFVKKRLSTRFWIRRP